MDDLNKYKSILNCATQNWKKDSLISNFGIFNQYLFVFVTIFQFLFSMLEYGIMKLNLNVLIFIYMYMVMT